MFFAGFTPQSGERLLRDVGFFLEVSKVRQEMDKRYGQADHHWIIARKPDD